MTEEDKQILKKHLNPKSLEDHIKVSKLLSGIIIELIKKHHFDEIYIEEVHDAKMILQIIHSKLSHILSACNGVTLIENGIKPVIDPSVHVIIGRNIFETVVFFNLLYIFYPTKEEKELVYKLWKLSSFKFRSRFAQFAKSEEAKQVIEEESKAIKDLELEIRSSQIYLNSSPQSIRQIEQAIKKKNFWIYIDNGEINTSYGPQYLCDKMTKDQPVLKEQYTRYSLFTHPSKETVNFFGNIYQNEDSKYFAGANLRVTNCLISMFISDYIYLFPACKKTFDEMSKLSQIVCNFYNKQIREEATCINETWKVIYEL